MTHYYAKITEVEGKTPSISDLATNAALNVTENKIPDVLNALKTKFSVFWRRK